MQSDKNGWISVEDCLPQEGEPCFISYIGNTGLDNWLFAYYNKSYVNITHWRPATIPDLDEEK